MLDTLQTASHGTRRQVFLVALLITSFIISITLPSFSVAATFSFDKLKLSVPDSVAFTPSETEVLNVTVSLKDGWHINTNDPIQKYLIPTKLSLDTSPLRLLRVDYPRGQQYTFSFSRQRLRVYSDTTVIRAVLEVPEDTEYESRDQSFQLTYQPCSDRQCLRPKRVQFTVGMNFLRE